MALPSKSPAESNSVPPLVWPLAVAILVFWGALYARRSHKRGVERRQRLEERAHQARQAFEASEKSEIDASGETQALLDADSRRESTASRPHRRKRVRFDPDTDFSASSSSRLYEPIQSESTTDAKSPGLARSSSSPNLSSKDLHPHPRASKLTRLFGVSTQNATTRSHKRSATAMLPSELLGDEAGSSSTPHNELDGGKPRRGARGAHRRGVSLGQLDLDLGSGSDSDDGPLDDADERALRRAVMKDLGPAPSPSDVERTLEYKMASVHREVLETERDYFQALQFLYTAYYQPLKKGFSNELGISDAQVDAIFSNVPALVSVHEAIFRDLEAGSHLGDALQKQPLLYVLYNDYVRNHGDAEDILDSINSNPAVQIWLDALNRRFKQNLRSLLIRPVQRLPRYLLLLGEMRKLRRKQLSCAGVPVHSPKSSHGTSSGLEPLRIPIAPTRRSSSSFDLSSPSADASSPSENAFRAQLASGDPSPIHRSSEENTRTVNGSHTAGEHSQSGSFSAPKVEIMSDFRDDMPGRERAESTPVPPRRTLSGVAGSGSSARQSQPSAGGSSGSGAQVSTPKSRASAPVPSNGGVSAPQTSGSMSNTRSRPPTPPDQDSELFRLSDAHQKIQQVLSRINENKREMEGIVHLAGVQSAVKKALKSDLLQPGRHLIKYGPLMKRKDSKRATAGFKDRYVFLMSDLLIWCSNGDKKKYKNMIRLSGASVRALPTMRGFAVEARVSSGAGGGGSSSNPPTAVFQCHSPAEAEEWVEQISKALTVLAQSEPALAASGTELSPRKRGSGALFDQLGGRLGFRGRGRDRTRSIDPLASPVHATDDGPQGSRSPRSPKSPSSREDSRRRSSSATPFSPRSSAKKSPSAAKPLPRPGAGKSPRNTRSPSAVDVRSGAKATAVHSQAGRMLNGNGDSSPPTMALGSPQQGSAAPAGGRIRRAVSSMFFSPRSRFGRSGSGEGLLSPSALESMPDVGMEAPDSRPAIASATPMPHQTGMRRRVAKLSPEQSSDVQDDQPKRGSFASGPPSGKLRDHLGGPVVPPEAAVSAAPVAG